MNYRNTNRKWKGFARSDHFAVRWTGALGIRKAGHYRFGIISDDGSKLWINNKYTVNNDGLHGWRNREGIKHLRPGTHAVRLEMFERGGHAGMMMRYKGPDTRNRWKVMRAHRSGYHKGAGWREEVFYFGQGGRCQNLKGRFTQTHRPSDPSGPQIRRPSDL